MVRLIGSDAPWGTANVWFQFQYGAIDRISLRTSTPLIDLFQFQYGAIDSFTGELCQILVLVSIPVWCDW